MSLVVVTANLDKDRAGDERLIQYAEKSARAAVKARRAQGAVLTLTETQPGPDGLAVQAVDGLRLGPERRREVVPYGTHNEIVWRRVRIDGVPVRQVVAHGLHRKTVGRARQAAYWSAMVALLVAWTARGIRWSLAGDFNLGFRAVARMLGGRGVGRGVDGVIVSRGLVVHHVRTDWWGVVQALTDHPMVVALVSAKPARKRPLTPQES